MALKNLSVAKRAFLIFDCLKSFLSMNPQKIDTYDKVMHTKKNEIHNTRYEMKRISYIYILTYLIRR
jgi:hypothetical protein